MFAGIFDLKGLSEKVNIDSRDRIYTNKINNDNILVNNGIINATGYPIIIKTRTEKEIL